MVSLWPWVSYYWMFEFLQSLELVCWGPFFVASSAKEGRLLSYFFSMFPSIPPIGNNPRFLLIVRVLFYFTALNLCGGGSEELNRKDIHSSFLYSFLLYLIHQIQSIISPIKFMSFQRTKWPQLRALKCHWVVSFKFRLWSFLNLERCATILWNFDDFFFNT